MAAADGRAWAEAALRGALISDAVLALGAEAWQELADPRTRTRTSGRRSLGGTSKGQGERGDDGAAPHGLVSGPSMSCKPCGCTMHIFAPAVMTDEALAAARCDA